MQQKSNLTDCCPHCELSGLKIFFNWFVGAALAVLGHCTARMFVSERGPRRDGSLVLFAEPAN